jgi:hypothetical protein
MERLPDTPSDLDAAMKSKNGRSTFWRKATHGAAEEQQKKTAR